MFNENYNFTCFIRVLDMSSHSEEGTYFGNRLLRKIFGSKEYEVTWDWRSVHNEEFVFCFLHLMILRGKK
jgi:hypothetical protein